MKILAVCEGGTNRSVCMARMLNELGKWKKHDVIAVGTMAVSKDTFAMLGRWADRIIVMADYIKPHTLPEYADKVTLCDVGKDTYGNCWNIELRALCETYIKGQKL